MVYETIRKWFATLDRPIGVASIPLLYSKRSTSAISTVVVVTACTAEQQLQRLIERGSHG